MTAEPQTFSGASRLARYASFVKLPHTVFALPFALVGVTLASYVAPVTPWAVAWVVVAFTAARFAAMGFNRIADRAFDARNPRTMARELPRGAITLGQAWASVIAASAIFVLAAGALNRLCLLLSPVALAWILTYSLSKRFTWWPHVWLGLSLAIAPVGGYLAVMGRWSDPAWPLLAVALAVATWVAGFDIFYALPDESFDRGEGLRSAVVRLGVPRAILAAKLLHGVTIPALALFGAGAGFGAWYYAGLVVAAGMLNSLCLALSPVALAWVFFYSFTKRFTRWSHLVLGLGLGIAPVGGYLAVTGRWAQPWWMLCALALAVMTWVGGFDVLYALQDEAFDRREGLHSLPVALGAPGAVAIARLLHLATVVLLALVGLATPAGGLWYFAGVAVAAGLLVYEHTLVRADDLSRLDAAFFTMNGIISITFFVFVLAERLVAPSPALAAVLW